MYCTGGGKRLRAAAAGTMCTPWSKVGDRTRWCHKDVLSHYAWLSDLRANKYDMVHLEQSDHFPIKTHAEQLKSMMGMTTVWIVLRPSDLGWPTHGCRTFAVSFTDRLVCLAPEDESMITHRIL